MLCFSCCNSVIFSNVYSALFPFFFKAIFLCVFLAVFPDSVILKFLLYVLVLLLSARRKETGREIKVQQRLEGKCRAMQRRAVQCRVVYLSSLVYCAAMQGNAEKVSEVQ